MSATPPSVPTPPEPAVPSSATSAPPGSAAPDEAPPNPGHRPEIGSAPGPEPATGAVSGPVTTPAPVVEPTVEPATDATSEPTVEPAPQPATDPAPQSGAERSPQSGVGPDAESDAESDADTGVGTPGTGRPAAPYADCVADQDGGLTFEVTDPTRPTGPGPGAAAAAASAGSAPSEPGPAPGAGGQPGTVRAGAGATAGAGDGAGGAAGSGEAAGSGPGDGAVLVLRRRGDEGEAAEHRLPLAWTDGRLRAVLPPAIVLAEGRWDVFLASRTADRDGAPQRLASGLNDLRALVDRQPSPGIAPLAIRIPYVTKYGNLSLRTWVRGPHAEAGELRVGDGEVTVRGRLHRVPDPAGWLAGAVLEARPRSGEDGMAPYSRPVVGDGATFSCTLPLAPLAAGAADGRPGPRVWDLWLRPAGRDAAPARLARILDDVADKGRIFTYPARRVAVPHGTAQAGPYYTKDNGLSIRIEEAG